jgi:hypothetical protein
MMILILNIRKDLIIMENIKRFTSFFEDYNDDLIEHLDGVRTYLQMNNKEYKDLQKQYTKILDNNEKIQNLLFGDKIEDTLTTKEYDLLYKAIELQERIQIIVEKELYFKGGMDAYYYFRKIGIIK